MVPSSSSFGSTLYFAGFIVIGFTLAHQWEIAANHQFCSDQFGSASLFALLAMVYQRPRQHHLGTYPGYLSLLCFLVGSVGLAGQWQMGRFLAYSAIVHVAYFLLAYGNLAFTSYLFYAFIYGLTVLNLLIVIGHGSKGVVRGGRYNFQFMTRTRANRALALAFAVSLFSLAAIPPLAGFFAKLTILAEEVHCLAILAVLASTLSAANYLTLVLLAILDLKVEPDFHFSLVLPPLTGYIIATLTLILALAGVLLLLKVALLMAVTISSLANSALGLLYSLIIPIAHDF